MSAPLEIEGPAAPPRSNGELVFAEPWESRAFGMAVSLYEAGAFTWPQFTEALIARIGAWEAASKPDEPYNYYQHWLDALQDVLAGLCAVSTSAHPSAPFSSCSATLWVRGMSMLGRATGA